MSKFTSNYEIQVWVQVTPSITLNDFTLLNNLLLNVNFDNSTVGLHYIHILFVLVKFHGEQRLIVMLSINYLNSGFCSLKIIHKR